MSSETSNNSQPKFPNSIISEVVRLIPATTNPTHQELLNSFNKSTAEQDKLPVGDFSATEFHAKVPSNIGPIGPQNPAE